MGAVELKEFSWERMIAAVEEVRGRACRAAAALRQAGIPHVVVGGHAVASWVARVDKEAVRNTKDVDLMVRRDDFPCVVDVLQSIGFIHQNVSGVDLFEDKVHLLDLLDVGLIDESWSGRLPPEIAARL